MFRKFLLRVRPEEYLAFFVLAIVMCLNTFVYGNAVTLKEAAISMFNYFTFGDPFYRIFFLVTYFVAIYRFYYVASNALVDQVVGSKRITKETLKDLVKALVRPIRAVLPIALVSGPMYELLGHMSFAFRETRYDILLAQIDLALFGRLLFIDVPMYFSSDFAGVVLAHTYTSLTYAIPLFLLFLLLRSYNNLLRLAVTTFVLSFVLAYPVYYVLPAQGPSYSILENVRNISLPPDIQAYSDRYVTSAYTKSRTIAILGILINKDKDNTSPISSFPSMHATWALIVVYYLYRVRKWTLFFSIPWIVSVLLGGIHLSQHYLIDYFAAIPVTALSIYLAHRLINQNITNVQG